MGITIVDTLDEEVWRKFVDGHPQGNIFHTPEMFQVFERARGHYPRLQAAIDADGQIQALLLPVRVTLMNGLLRRLTTRAIIYGGVLCSTGPTGKTALEILLSSYSKKAGRETLYTEVRNLSDLSTLQPELSKCGFVYEDHLDYLIDLSGSPTDVLKNIGSRTRKHIRRALHKGIVIIEEMGDPDLLPVWYELVRNSYTTAHVPLADRSLFEAAFNILQPSGSAKFWLARIDSKYVAAMVELYYKDTIYGWYSGVDRTFSAESPSELMTWRVLERGSMDGFKIYDFGGAGRPDEKYGVRDFKAKFGGQLVCYGRNTYTPSPVLLRLSTLGYNILRHIIWD